MKMQPTPTIEEIKAKVAAITDTVRLLVDREHMVVEGLVAAELTAAFVMKHQPGIRRAITAMQAEAVTDWIQEMDRGDDDGAC